MNMSTQRMPLQDTFCVMKAYKIQLETLLYHNIFTIRMSKMRPGVI